MSNTELRKQIQEDFFILDGATGSNLQKAGMKSGECPEQWILNHPDIFIDLQKKIYWGRIRCCVCTYFYQHQSEIR